MKNETLEDLKKLGKEEIYILMRNFDLEVGEDFIDYNENYVKNSNLAFYLLGKGLITNEKVNKLMSANSITLDLNEFLEACGIENYLKKRWILSEISANFDTLLKRLIKTYEEHDLSFKVSEDAKKFLIDNKEYEYGILP